MKLLGPIWLASALLTPACAAFLHPPPVKTIDGNWSSPLDADLRIAAADEDAYIAKRGWPIELRWAGVQGAVDYNIERSPSGEPLRKAARVLFAFYYPARHKCYLSAQMNPPYDDQLVRENTGGGSYAKPSLVVEDPLKGEDHEPVGAEVVCSAIQHVDGGIHVHADGEWPAEVVAQTPPAT